ncbi:MAG: response regulator transcription factor [Spartobacteria bacterium]|nr:response regulator transcription factor [Spartobacteria bacterium]
MTKPIRIIIADDHDMMRAALKSLVQNDERITIVGEAANGVQTIRLAAKLRPHVVVMDVSMPDMNGIEATRAIVKDNPMTRVVALSGHAGGDFVREMLTAGASAYVIKKCAYEELSRAIRETVAGRKYLSAEVTRGIVDGFVELSASESRHPAFLALTTRERETLQRLTEGHSTKEIAGSLGVSVKTIETHRRNIMEKLNVFSVAELTKYALREGITSLDA